MSFRLRCLGLWNVGKRLNLFWCRWFCVLKLVIGFKLVFLVVKLVLDIWCVSLKRYRSSLIRSSRNVRRR